MRVLPPLICLAGLAMLVPVRAQEEAHTASANGMTVVHAWARATDAGQTGLVFMEIVNMGEADTLTGGSSAVAASVAIVGLSLGADGTQLQPVGPVQIATGEFALDPGGIALALEDLAAPLQQGQHFDLVLDFAIAGPLEIEVEIEAADATQHSHAGHSH